MPRLCRGQQMLDKDEKEVPGWRCHNCHAIEHQEAVIDAVDGWLDNLPSWIRDVVDRDKVTDAVDDAFREALERLKAEAVKRGFMKKENG